VQGVLKGIPKMLDNRQQWWEFKAVVDEFNKHGQDVFHALS